MKTPFATICATVSACFCGAASAQPSGPPLGWSGIADGLAVWQGNAGLSGGGEFSAQRTFLRGGGIYRFSSGASAGVIVSAGRFSYDFSAPAAKLWDDVSDLRISVPLRFQIGSNVDAFVVPSLRYDYESGAGMSDGSTYGVFAGFTWKFSDSLSIGPGVGVFSELDEDDPKVFPALLVNWDINDRLRLSTAGGLGATQGPGLTLSYQKSDALSFALSARSENVRFRLDGTGLAPGGVGEDSSFPVVASVSYKPNRNVSLSAFVGAEFGGELQLDNAAGVTVSQQDYDAAPIAGFTFRILF